MKIHDRYILGGFWRNLLLGFLAFTVIYVTVDLSEETDNFYDNKATAREVVSYYFYQLPWILLLTMPISVLLSTVFTLGRMSRENELTALVAAGMPLTRIARPILISAFFISLASLAFSELIVPFANRRAERIMSIDIEQRRKQDSFKYRKNLHYQGEGNRTWYAERYDIKLSVLLNVALHEHEDAKLVRRVDAKKAFWDGSKWVFMDGAVRDFLEEGETVTTFKRKEMPHLPEKPEDIAKEEIVPEEMNFLELRDHIDKIRRGGGGIDKYLVDLYFKFSFPFTSLIFAVIGAALSSAKRKPSMATGFGLTLLISFMYYGILRVGQSLGHSGVLPPLLGAWMGNLIFVVLGAIMLYRANK
ncbi:MAG: LptF/LptG family permease [Candidatus Krumholzibacteria bacterium]|nr:LptF/LptG family permease [Candidatus Krumholzibacteria bacterium]